MIGNGGRSLMSIDTSGNETMLIGPMQVRLSLRDIRNQDPMLLSRKIEARRSHLRLCGSTQAGRPLISAGHQVLLPPVKIAPVFSFVDLIRNQYISLTQRRSSRFLLRAIA